MLGAWLRWGLSYWLNPRLEQLPLGTLTANLVGGYLIGVAVAVFAVESGAVAVLAPAAHHRLSRRPDDLFHVLRRERRSARQGVWGGALLHAGLHLVGSLLATAAGIASVRLLT